ncbi:MAG TPA: amino acid adenylation domain-containing protein [Longimicrobium sp.]|nr:amino acid adenylation domain-containing protein [Longimicrobium sp.]
MPASAESASANAPRLPLGDGAACAHHLFQASAAERPHAPAVAHAGATLSFAELDRRSSAVAARLQAMGVGPEGRVAVLLERGPALAAALLGVLKAGAAYVPLDPEYPAERIAYVLDDSRAAAVLAGAGHALPPTAPPVVEVESILDAEADGFVPVEVGPETLAYVIYTSGSTGRPKGVGVSHRSLVSHNRTVIALFGLQAADRVAQIASVGFDISVEEIFPTWAAGAAVVFRPAEVPGFGSGFVRWLAQDGITVLNIPTAFWHAWVDDLATAGATPPESLRLVIVGGERADPKELARWRQLAGERVRWINSYGPTEATVTATSWELEGEVDGEVPIGRALDNTRAYVLDEALRPVADGEAGELFLGGASVARGYLGRPGLTAERFVPDAFGDTPGARLYRTGDRVRARSGGVLEFIGRLDDQVKVGGFRVEPGEVEAVLSTHPAVARAAVVARDDGTGRTRLVGYAVAKEGETVDAAGLRRWLRARLPAYMVPSAIVPLETLPLSVHGKVDRRALPAPAVLEPLDTDWSDVGETARALAEIFREVLGAPSVGRDDDFFELGGHSLLGMQVLSRVRQQWGVELPVRAVFDASTVAALAARIDAARGEPAAPQPPLRPVRRDGELPLSYAQQRLWFLHQMEPESPFYNIPAAVRLSGELDAAALRRALLEIVRRHEALRTTFLATAEGSAQVVHPAPHDFDLPIHDFSSLSRQQADGEAMRVARDDAETPFDLTRDRMLRAVLVRLSGDEHVLVLNLHHVAGDGWSIGVLFRELAALYEAFAAGRPSPLPMPVVQYADYAVWQREWLREEVLEDQLAYWRNRLAGAPAVLELPTDRARPAVQTYRGEVIPFEVPAELTSRLREAARREGGTLFMVLLAGFDLLIHRLSGRDDVVVGSPIAGRVRREVEGLIGFFVNTMALRTDLSGDPTVAELIGRVREATLEAYAHQDLPFERVVEELQPERTLSHNPLFQVAFALQNVKMEPVDAPGLRLKLEDVDSGTSKFDMFLEMLEDGSVLRGNLEYATDLWERATVERMIALLIRLLDALAGERSLPVSRARLLEDAEAIAQVRDWNHTARPYPRDASIHELFQERALATPNAVALEWVGGKMTYAELDIRSNRLAHHLIGLGVRPDQPVAIAADRSAAMVVAVLGILKAGGAYVPINPKYPKSRVALMLDDSGARVLITETALAGALPAHGLATVLLDGDAPRIAAQPPHPTGVEVAADSTAYIMYTSGSTGRPKGVIVPHRAVLRLVLNSDFARFGADEVWLQLAPIAFDASTLELWAPLLNGGRLALYPPVPVDPAELGGFIRRHGVTSAWLTAGLFHQMVDTSLETIGGLHQLLAGGDVLSVSHVSRVLDAFPHVRLINGYGPTENTTFSCCRTIVDADAERASIPIGGPIANSTAYVLDRNLHPAGPDVPGELFVGGDGVARGYLKAHAFTAERYLPDPFVDRAGVRMYRTGDRVRRRPDGSIEFLGRIDEQVKIRGYRIEPGEVEAVLERSPSVAKAVVHVREDVPGDKRLVAYVIPARPDAVAEVAEAAAETADRQVSQWESLFDDVYTGSRGTEEGDETFDIIGWNSSYTGQPIPPEEMREWVERTVERILALDPRKVLELGVGTGLLLFRVAPVSTEYLGTDFSAQVLARLEGRLRTAGVQLPPVRLLQREAADFGGIDARRHDTAILNSVCQYFPTADYFAAVVEKTADALEDGGAFFVGDVRNLWTLDAFRTAIEFDSAPGSVKTADLRQRCKRIVEEEEELLVEPDFFRALQARIPRVSRVEARVKRGQFHNELTRHRYDVVVHVGPAVEMETAQSVDWEAEELTLDGLRARLAASHGQPLAVLGIPNARLWRELRIVELLEMEEGPETVAEARAILAGMPSPAIDPEELWALGEQLGLAVEIRHAGPQAPDAVDALFRPAERAVAFPERVLVEKEPREYANDPLWAAQARDLAPRLRAWVKEQLPEHMVPSALVVMDAFPLTPNGKVDRRALPAPEPQRLGTEEACVEPRTETEEKLAAIWAEVLRLERVFVDDNFFDLGGHSLLATQLATRVREAFSIELPLQRIFESPTVAMLAEVVDATKDDALSALLDDLDSLSDDEVQALLEAEAGAFGGSGFATAGD